MINCNLNFLLTFCSATLLLTACTSPKEVVFVTKSSLSVVDIESTPASITFGYDRIEGYYAPSYENGAVPPVLSSIRTDGGLFAPKIKQLYATGEAANIVLAKDTPYDYHNESDLLTGNKNRMFFGTSTNLGFKVGVTKEIPSLNLGYKRIEASYIPIGNIGGVDKYPSVIASIDTTIKVPKGNNLKPDGLQGGQYFATGSAAKQLAQIGFVRDAFTETGEDAIKKYEEELYKQTAYALRTLKCAASLKDPHWSQVIEEANKHEVLGSQAGEIVEKMWQSYLLDKTIEKRQQAVKLYFSAISNNVKGSSPTYTPVLESHKDLVCKLAKEANNV